MKFYNILPVVALFFLTASCASATVHEPDVCATVNLGTLPVSSSLAGTAFPPVSFTANYDFSNVVDKLDDVTKSLSVNINTLTLSDSTDLTWLTRADVYIDGGTSSTPNTLLASYLASTDQVSNNSVSVQIQMDSNTLLEYLKNPITLTFNIYGNYLPTAMTLDNTVCVGVSGSFSKSF